MLKFIVKIEGVYRKKGMVVMMGVVFLYLGAFLDHAPGCLLLLSSFFSPIFFIISTLLFSYGIIGIVEGASSYYRQVNICLVHRGKISRGEKLYYCPSCKTPYCQKCYEQVIKQDGCWNCGASGKDKPKAKFKEEIIDDKSKDKLKDPKLPKKKLSKD